MNLFFSGKSAGERATLYHIKNIFGHHSVKADVSQSFNHVADLMGQVTDCYAILLAKKVLKLDSLQSQPECVDSDQMHDPDYRQHYLDNTCEEMLSAFWQNITVLNLGEDAEGVDGDDEFPFCHCREGR
jgi:hypothetical protein